jgi:hypothetical protein
MNLTNLGVLTNLSLLAPAAATSTSGATSAAGIDLQQYEGVLNLCQEVGVVSGTSPTLTGKIQDSADNSTFADVTGYAFTEVTATGNLQTLQIDTRTLRRYIQYVGTIAGTTPVFNLSVRAVGCKKQIP